MASKRKGKSKQKKRLKFAGKHPEGRKAFAKAKREMRLLKKKEKLNRRLNRRLNGKD